MLKLREILLCIPDTVFPDNAQLFKPKCQTHFLNKFGKRVGNMVSPVVFNADIVSLISSLFPANLLCIFTLQGIYIWGVKIG